MDIHRCRSEELNLFYDFWLKYRPGAERKDLSPQELARLRHDVFDNPFSNGEGTSWLAWEENRPIGHLRENPCPAYYHGVGVKSVWWQSFFVLPDTQATPRGDAAALLVLKLRAQRYGHAVLGTPGVKSQVFKLYQRMGFDYWGPIPFFYYVVDGAKVLRNLGAFKRPRPLAWAAALASGLYFPSQLLAVRHWRPRRFMGHCGLVTWPFFPPDADVLWQNLLRRYKLIFDRSARYLSWRYSGRCYERLGLIREKRLVGWIVCKTTQMERDKYFGNMRVGTLVDFFVDPENRDDALTIFSLAVERLIDNGADLIVTNLSHHRFIDAASRVGFIRGPSNYHFFTAKLRPVELDQCHLTRGDSDGDYFL